MEWTSTPNQPVVRNLGISVDATIGDGKPIDKSNKNNQFSNCVLGVLKEQRDNQSHKYFSVKIRRYCSY